MVDAGQDRNLTDTWFENLQVVVPGLLLAYSTHLETTMPVSGCAAFSDLFEN